MKTAILKADGCIKAETDYAYYLAQALAQQEIGHDVLDLTDARLPLANYDVFLLTGGSTPASSKSAWMQRTIKQVAELCRAAGRNEVFLFGICLGSQVIANAWAGKNLNKASQNGLEFGFNRVRCLESGNEAVVFQFHYEEVDEAFLQEPDVVLTHTNRHSHIQGYRIGDNIRAYQFHPEIPPQALTAVAAYNSELLSRHGMSVEESNLNTSDQESQNETFIFAPLRRFLAG